ncbi:hypothetical protein [Extibacter muris]|uniref:hypothetical protein n=1 Tax=Extibacter muris TaxID=1796622 RepID=UPI0029CA11C4|nr:hypothetical protein [Extibacter muris]
MEHAKITGLLKDRHYPGRRQCVPHQRSIKAYHYRLKEGVFEDSANGYPIGEYKNRRNMQR